MLLHWSPASPFARKVLACAIARGLDGRIELVETNPHASPDALLAVNPLSKIPCLIADDGTAIYDSPVICDYLDTLGDAPPMMPATGPARLEAALMQALADGIMDAAVARRGQVALPQDEGRIAFDKRQKAAVDRALDRLEAEPPRGLEHVGHMAVAAALGYLDFRFPAEPWRPTRPKLAAWLAQVSALPPLKRTEPSLPK
jgi:glutathione S-transferase